LRLSLDPKTGQGCTGPRRPSCDRAQAHERAHSRPERLKCRCEGREVFKSRGDGVLPTKNSVCGPSADSRRVRPPPIIRLAIQTSKAPPHGGGKGPGSERGRFDFLENGIRLLQASSRRPRRSRALQLRHNARCYPIKCNAMIKGALHGARNASSPGGIREDGPQNPDGTLWATKAIPSSP
jgi:hypothetical protein